MGFLRDIRSNEAEDEDVAEAEFVESAPDSSSNAYAGDDSGRATLGQKSAPDMADTEVVQTYPVALRPRQDSALARSVGNRHTYQFRVLKGNGLQEEKSHDGDGGLEGVAKKQARGAHANDPSNDAVSALINLPIMATLTAGSIVIKSMQRAARGISNVVRPLYHAARVNGHAVIGSQLDQAVERVVDLASKVKAAGMGDLINEMRNFGAASDIVSKMGSDATLEVLGKRWHRLMENPGLAQHCSELLVAMRDFSDRALAYARVGAKLDVDFVPKLETAFEKVSRATEGIVVKNGEAFEHLQDRVRALADRITDMLLQLFKRLSPGAA